VRQAIDDPPGALVLHWPVDLRDGRKEIVQYVQSLRDAGAIAVRLEQSRLGWDVSRWLKLFSPSNPAGCMPSLCRTCEPRWTVKTRAPSMPSHRY
jgi:hypothetical protein